MKYSLMSADDLQILRSRLAVIIGAVVVLFLVLVLRLFYLQILNGEYYEELAKGNRIRVMPEEAPRGIIYDRTGVILAFNRPAFNVQIIPEDAENQRVSLDHLSNLTDVPFSQLWKTFRDNRSSFKFKPVLLLKDIGRTSADLIDTYQEDLPGISVAIESKRLYPTAYLSSHVLGYVGVINEEQLKDLPLKNLYSGRIVGQAGIENVLNDLLIGLDGGRQVEMDNVGRELRTLSQPVKPTPGNDVVLTIDLRLQRQVRTLMAGKKGVVIVMNPRTGEILSMNSFPDYDPNQFIGGIKDHNWSKLTGGVTRPLINKVTQGVYPPGSTFKMVLALAGLDSGIITKDTTYNCPGFFRLNREISYCWKRSGHGNVNVEEALAQSCNVFFYKLGQELGVDRIGQYAAMLGFGEPTGVEMESEKKGLLPSREWKLRLTGEKWYDGETIPVSIGQGFINVTPIQLLNYVNVIANRGLWVRPTLVKQIVSPDGQELVSGKDLPRQTRLLPIAVENFAPILEGMEQAVNGNGTAGRAAVRGYVVAGKTGTSQVVGRLLSKKEMDEVEERLLPHSLFVGFAPAEAPQVSLLVLVEHGRAGSTVAAPLAREILEYYTSQIQPFEDAEKPSVQKRFDPKSRFRNTLKRAFVEPEPQPAQAAGSTGQGTGN